MGYYIYILLQISCIGRQRKSVKNYEHWLTLSKAIAIIQRVTFLLVRFVLRIVQSCLDATTKETISARKNVEKYAISTLIFEKFSGGIAPGPHAGERLRRPSPDLTRSALRASAPRFLHRQSPNISWGLFGPPKNFGVAPL